MASENEQEKRETLADIVAEIRAYGAQPPPRLMWLEIADRIEAIDSADAWRSLYTPPVGNAAAMRETLATLRKRFDNNTMAYQDRYFKFSGWHWHKKATEAARWRDVFHELREVCDAAISAPARNCDRYKDAPSAYADFIVPWKLDGHLDDVPTLQDFANWLFAPAAERKGEGDGK